VEKKEEDADYDQQLKGRILKLEAANLTRDELLRRAAAAEMWAAFIEEAYESSRKANIDHEDILANLNMSLRDHACREKNAMQSVLIAAKEGMEKALLAGSSLQKQSQARRGAKAKLANDPKQAAKSIVKECWGEWQRKPSSYKGKSAFAKDMMTKFEALDNQAVITRWCGQWEKEAAK